MSGLEQAIAFACEAHAGQVDKQGEPYIRHCLRVMEAVSDEARRVAVLHDVVEDTAATTMSVWEACDLSVIEVSALLRLTRHPGESYDDYIRLCASGQSRCAHLTREVKVADLRDNLDRWTPQVGATLRDRYLRALARPTNGET